MQKRLAGYLKFVLRHKGLAETKLEKKDMSIKFSLFLS